LSRKKILVIEDELDILEVIEFNLSREGYDVICASNGEEGLRKVREKQPHLVLLDIMLPGLDGIEVCKRLQADPQTKRIPVIMVTAKGEESDIVLGLGVGADDYIAKPFSPRELVARVKAVLRRGALQQEEVATRIEREGLVIDKARHEVLVDGETVTFTPTELRLLYFLASRPGRVFTREQILDRVLGEHVVVTDRNIDVHIRAVRQKLGRHRDLIETIRGLGYRFRDT
jgi:two-component system phosphate regulon response regulator PhoB